MFRLFFALFILSSFFSACSTDKRAGVLSQELPLTLQDLVEIRDGERNHENVLSEYPLCDSPKLELYLNAIARNIADVSTRPHLPYKVYILDTDEVNMFGGPGGYMYITRGLFNFVESESEIAGLIAHEISHIANYEYDNIPHHDRMKKVYGLMMKGSELAKDSIGTYGTAAHYGLKGIGKAAPVIAQRFGVDQEIGADENTLKYLIAAGYDPHGFGNFVDRLARVPMGDVNRFVLFLNTHPPFQARQDALQEALRRVNIEGAKIELKKDTLNEVRQITLKAPDSIVFEPQLGVHRLVPGGGMSQMNQEQKKEIETLRKHWNWF